MKIKKYYNLDEYRNIWYISTNNSTIDTGDTVEYCDQQQPHHQLDDQQQNQHHHHQQQQDNNIPDNNLSTTITKMPSKQASDVLAVEELVHEIKENLRLKARPSHNHGRNSRPSPYHIPCRSWNDQNMGCGNNNNNINMNNNTCDKTHHTNHHHLHHLHRHNNKKDEDNIDDPYELLQALLKSKNLVKEAVRRLQLNISPKQRYFYESDEESRSPIFRVCQLEL